MNKSSRNFACGMIAIFSSSMLAAGIAETKPALPRPLSLDAALTIAAQYNPALLQTREKIKEQEGILIEAKSVRLPNLGITGSLTKTDKDLLEVGGYEDSNWTMNVKVSQVLYAGGGIQARIHGQREQLEAAKFQYSAAVNDTVLLVRQQFYTVLLNRELIVVHEEAMHVLETELTNARNRQTAGTGSDFDVLRAEVAVANAKPPLIRAHNDYRVAQDKLRASLGVLGDPSSTATDLGVEGTLEVSRREISLPEAIALARTHRPEVLRQERMINASVEDITRARGGYLPTISAVAGYEWTKPSLISTTRSHLDGWTAGIQANWNIFEGRATSAQVAQARSRLNQNRHASDEVDLAVDVEVRQAHSALTEATELLNASTMIVTQARESLRIAKVRFDAGTSTQLDVLQAQSALTDAHSNLAQAQYAYATALAAMERATGTLLAINR